MLAVLMMNEFKRELKILVVAAHSDDEVLGCGGTLLRHRSRGDKINLMLLTNGVGSRGINEGATRRALASQIVSEKLGVYSHTQLDFPDNQLDTVPLLELVKSIELVATSVRPDIVYTHHAGDLNIDHRVCSEAVLTAFRSLPETDFFGIYGFEVQSSTEWSPRIYFNPTHFVNVAGYLEDKKELMSIYKDEVRNFPHPRSLIAIDALAKWRGSTAGFEAAEAFVILKSRWQ